MKQENQLQKRWTSQHCKSAIIECDGHIRKAFPSQELPCSGSTGIISAISLQHPGNPGAR